MEQLKQYIDATNTHDFANLIPLIHPKADYLFNDKRCSGIKEIEEYFIKTWGIIKNEVYKAQNSTLLMNTPDTKIYLYEYCYSGYLNNEYIFGKGRATNVFIKFDDSWQLVHEHLSTITEHNF